MRPSWRITRRVYDLTYRPWTLDISHSDLSLRDVILPPSAAHFWFLEWLRTIPLRRVTSRYHAGNRGALAAQAHWEGMVLAPSYRTGAYAQYCLQGPAGTRLRQRARCANGPVRDRATWNPTHSQPGCVCSQPALADFGLAEPAAALRYSSSIRLATGYPTCSKGSGFVGSVGGKPFNSRVA